MIRLFVVTLYIGLFSLYSQAQTQSGSVGQNMKVETTREAQYPQGDEALFSHLYHDIHYSDDAKKNKAEGEITVSFYVEADGSVSNVKIIKDIGFGCGDAVKEALLKIKYSPAMVNGTVMKSKLLLNVPVRAH